MKIKAAVLYEPNKPLKVKELELAPPKEKEILIKSAFTGFCHTDLHSIVGNSPSRLPLVVGHEVAGVVEAVGPGVTRFKKGDHAVPSFMMPCGECENCREGRGYICKRTMGLNMQGGLLDGTSRITDESGNPYYHHFLISGFSSHIVVPEQGSVPVRSDLPLEQACFFACCMPTGYGAVVNAANVKPGDRVAVWGIGGVGLNIIRGAKLQHANPIIAVDLEGSKEEIARQFGATHFINNSKDDPVPIIKEITGGGVKYAFEAIGDAGAWVQAAWSLRSGGKIVQTGVAPPNSKIVGDWPLRFAPPQCLSTQGVLYGLIDNYRDIPIFADMAMNGDLMLDKLTTKKFKLEDINEVVEAMKNRQIQGRWVCEWE